MKGLCIGLLAANILYFSWEYNQQLERARTEPSLIPPLPANVERLTLVRELAHPPSPLTEQSEPPPTTPEPSSQVCMSVGPFPSKSAAATVREWFEDRELETAEREESQEEVKRYWVYLKPPGSEEATQQMLEDLERKGVEDYLLLSKGEMAGAISLGIYGTQKTVERRLAELAQKGYSPEVAPHTSVEQTYYWIDVWGEMAEAVITEGRSRFPAGVSAVPIPCSEIAMRNPNP